MELWQSAQEGSAELGWGFMAPITIVEFALKGHQYEALRPPNHILCSADVYMICFANPVSV